MSLSDQEAEMRLNYRAVLPDALKPMLGLEHVANSGLNDPRLLNLIKIRASQINGCAYCVRLHAIEARERGETDERLDLVAVWREADRFGGAERAALGGARRSPDCPTQVHRTSSSTSSRATSPQSKSSRSLSRSSQSMAGIA